jgi:hypothetical protein
LYFVFFIFEKKKGFNLTQKYESNFEYFAMFIYVEKEKVKPELGLMKPCGILCGNN